MGKTLGELKMRKTCVNGFECADGLLEIANGFLRSSRVFVGNKELDLSRSPGTLGFQNTGPRGGVGAQLIDGIEHTEFFGRGSLSKRGACEQQCKAKHHFSHYIEL